jgi:hypothetical protein
MVQLMDYRHKDYIIRPQSEQLRSGRWSAKALVHLHRGGRLTVTPIYSEEGREFATESEANAYALQLARNWIDAHG